MEPQKEIRKNQNLLYTSGRATMVFAFWSFVRIIIYFIFNQQDIKELAGTTISEPWFLAMVEAVALLIAFLYSFLFFQVGQHAVDEARFRKKHRTLLVRVVVILTLSIYTLVTDLMLQDQFSSVETISMFLTDVVSTLFIIQLIRSTLFIRRHQNAD